MNVHKKAVQTSGNGKSRRVLIVNVVIPIQFKSICVRPTLKSGRARCGFPRLFGDCFISLLFISLLLSVLVLPQRCSLISRTNALRVQVVALPHHRLGARSGPFQFTRPFPF
jgi:hypothetical protein